jgi:hypothetical protein
MFSLFILIKGAAGMARILRAQAAFDLLATRPTVVGHFSLFNFVLNPPHVWRRTCHCEKTHK